MSETAHPKISKTRKVLSLTFAIEMAIAFILIFGALTFFFSSTKRASAVSMEKAISNNLRQIAAAADQYFIETGATETGMNDIIDSKAYLKSVKPINGETYESLFPIKNGFDALTVETKDSQQITFRK